MSHSDARRIATTPDPFEPFLISQGFRLGDLLILSGRAALDENGELIGEGDFDALADGRTLPATT